MVHRSSWFTVLIAPNTLNVIVHLWDCIFPQQTVKLPQNFAVVVHPAVATAGHISWWAKCSIIFPCIVMIWTDMFIFFLLQDDYIYDKTMLIIINYTIWYIYIYTIYLYLSYSSFFAHLVFVSRHCDRREEETTGDRVSFETAVGAEQFWRKRWLILVLVDDYRL